MRWVGRRELDCPLDFHSLSEKTPPNYQITGDLGCESGVGATLQLLPLPLQVLGLPGIRASTRSPQTQGWIHTQGWPSHRDGAGRSCLFSPPSCPSPAWAP